MGFMTELEKKDARRWGPWVAGLGGGLLLSALIVGAFTLGRGSRNVVTSPTPASSIPVTSPLSPLPSPLVPNPLPGLLPDVPPSGCVASVGDAGPNGTEYRLSAVRGFLTVAALPGTSIDATFHMPNGDFRFHSVSNTSGGRIGYAFIDFRLDNMTPLNQIPSNFNIVVDVYVQQTSSTYHCATQFLPGT